MSNNAFGLGNRTFINWLEEHNQIDNAVVRGDTRLLRGFIVDVKDHHHISQTYDVEIQDFKNEYGQAIVLRACKRMVQQSSFDGVGEYSPLEEGDPVLLLSPNGKLEDSIIIGTNYTLGNYKNYLREGVSDEPFKVHESFNGQKTAAQPSVHPSRIAQPDSYVRIVGTKNFQSPFDDPKYHKDKNTQREASPQIGSIEIRNKVGDIVNYSTGAQVYYADADILIVTNASGTSRCTRLNNMAAYYGSMVDRIQSYLGVSSTSDEDQEEVGEVSEDQPQSLSGSTNNPSLILSGIDSNRANLASIDFNEWSPTQYHLEQAQKLAKIYREAASSCIEGSLMNNSVAEALRVEEEDDRLEEYVDAEIREATPGECNYGHGHDSTKDRLFVIHETGVSADDAIAAVGSSGTGISYHGIIHRDGSITKFLDHSDTAYASGESSFNGESSTHTSSSNAVSVLAVARGEVGVVESPPGSNKNKYGEWYGMDNVPWCAIFVSYCFYKAGSPLPPITTEKGFAYCPYGVSYFKDAGKFDMNPKPGCIVFFDWEGDGVSNHVGIVEEVKSADEVVCIEGNTSTSDNSNGGQVMRRTRSLSLISGFAHPDTSSSCPPRSVRGVDPFSIQYALESGDGYTEEQYKTLAQVVKATGIPSSRITNHGEVSSSTRVGVEPAGFDNDSFNQAINSVGG